MAFGKLGAVVVRENVSSGDGSLEIMIPGWRINVIWLYCRIGNFHEIVDYMEENSIIYINYIATIIHYCGETWSGSVNRNDGDSYLITWKLPDTDDGDNEKNE